MLGEQFLELGRPVAKGLDRGGSQLDARKTDCFNVGNRLAIVAAPRDRGVAEANALLSRGWRPWCSR